MVDEAMLSPLKEALPALLAERLSADAIKGALVHLLTRLRVGVEQLRPSKQLAPWMAEVVGKVAGGSTPTTSEPRIATALLPYLDLLAPEHAEVLRLTDHGPLTQRAAATRLGIPLVTLKARVSAARRHLRRVVLTDLHLLAPVTPDTTPPEPSPDTRPRRRRVQPSALLPAFTTALEDLVRPWVPAEHISPASQALLTHIHTALTARRRQTRLGPWLHAFLYATLLFGPWSSTLLSLPPPTPSPADSPPSPPPSSRSCPPSPPSSPTPSSSSTSPPASSTPPPTRPAPTAPPSRTASSAPDSGCDGR